MTKTVGAAARELEAVMLRQMLRESGLADGLRSGGGLAGDLFVDTIADVIARSGGLGLAHAVEGQLAPSPQAAIPPPRPGGADALTALVAGRGRISSDYGPRTDPIDGRASFHGGVDIAAPSGAPIHTPLQGIVTFAGTRGGHGNVVEVEHENGVRTRYSHAERLLVRPGDSVERGQAIATVGSTGRSTGPHVHVELYVHGAQADPSALKDLLERDE